MNMAATEAWKGFKANLILFINARSKLLKLVSFVLSGLAQDVASLKKINM
jgi:hypothetical protein